MKKKRLPPKESIAVIIFSLIFCASLALARPFFSGLKSRLRLSVEDALLDVERATGLSVSYRTLSPSVFSGIRLKDISVRDSFDGEDVLDIKAVSLRYSFSRLVRGDFLHIFKDLTVDGMTVSLDGRDDALLFERLDEFFRKVSTDEKGLSTDVKTSRQTDLDFSGVDASSSAVRILDFLQHDRLFDVYIKNVHIRYTLDLNTADAFFKKISVNILEKTRQVSLETRGSLLWYGADSGRSLSCAFSAGGKLEENLDGSALILRISDFTDGNFNFKRLSLLFSYASSTASFSTVQNSYPFSFSGRHDFSSSKSELHFKTRGLVAGKLISSRQSNRIISALDGISLSLEADALFDFTTRRFSYSSGGKIFLSDGIFKGSEEVSYFLRGDEKSMNVGSLVFKGERLNGDFSGSLDFRTLSLSGAMNLHNYTLLNGGEISTEVFFEPRSRGFMAFSPQLMFDQKAFTALQLEVSPTEDSVDFSFELSDYSHHDYEKPGLVSLGGSFLSKIGYLQANVSASDLFADSVAESVLFFLEKKGAGPDFLSPYMMNGEFYLSTDFKTLSYNMPYLLVANTQKDDQFIFASVDGNDTSISVSRLDLIFGGNVSNLSAQVDLSPDYNEAFFTVDASHNSVPYHLSGSYMSDVLGLSGDYGLSAEFHNFHNGRFSGDFSMESLPVKIMGSMFTFSLDSGFSYSREEGVNLVVTRFEAEDAGSKFNFHPRLMLSGSVTKYGAVFDDISYSDRYSALSGPLTFSWHFNDGIFSSGILDFHMKNQISSEGFSLDAEISNPNLVPLDSSTLKSDLYLTSRLVATNLGLSRFLSESSDNNQATATLIASGTLESPYVAADVSSIRLMLAGSILSVSGSGYAEGKNVSIENLDVSYSGFDFEGMKADYDLETFTGRASALFKAGTKGMAVRVPLELKMSDSVVSEKGVLEDFVLTLDLKNIGGSLFAKEIPERVTLLHSKGASAVYTSDFLGVSGYISQKGDIDFSIAPGKAVSASLSGNVSGKDLLVDLKDVSVDLAAVMSYLNVPDLKIYRGAVRGAMSIRGLASDPDFGGGFTLSSLEMSLPNLVPSRIWAPRVYVNLSQNQVSVPEFRGVVKKTNPILASADIFFERWFFDRLEARLRTPENSYIPVGMKVPLLEAKGDVALDLDISLQDSYMDVTGAVAFRKANAKVVTGDLLVQAQGGEPPFYVHTDLNVFLGQHVNFNFDPILRAVFVPDQTFRFRFDTEDSSFYLDGDILLRSGDIAYLNRNFYLKNGIIRFNPNETSINPYITLTAETRDKDDSNNDVRIILSANNQPLNGFQPIFTSIPPKSENEIRELLGQIALGDSDRVSSLLIATGDYAIQSTIGRTVENTLREYLNFDIFSLRTNVLQNAIRQTLSNGSSEMKIGNYLDNSTVYIGKYFGSSLYVDALMHLSYDDSILGNEDRGQGLTFHPEIGFEMDISQMFFPLWDVFLPKIGLNPNATVANIRFSLAPEFDFGRGFSNVNLASSTSVTLSWKFSF